MAAAGQRYAPEDPTLPKPWRGLVDGRTGNLYFWNSVTNVTQYQRPKDLAPEPDVTEKQSSDAPTAVVSSIDPETDNGVAGDDLGHESSGNGGLELPSETKVDDETTNGGSDHSYEPPKETVAFKTEETPARVHVPLAGSGLSPDAYRRKHDITVSGTDVPPPFKSFEETGFPSELLREIYVLRWRICFWLSTIPSTVLALAMIFYVESPHWLYKKGRKTSRTRKC